MENQKDHKYTLSKVKCSDSILKTLVDDIAKCSYNDTSYSGGNTSIKRNLSLSGIYSNNSTWAVSNPKVHINLGTASKNNYGPSCSVISENISQLFHNALQHVQRLCNFTPTVCPQTKFFSIATLSLNIKIGRCTYTLKCDHYELALVAASLLKVIIILQGENSFKVEAYLKPSHFNYRNSAQKANSKFHASIFYVEEDIVDDKSNSFKIECKNRATLAISLREAIEDYNATMRQRNEENKKSSNPKIQSSILKQFTIDDDITEELTLSGPAGIEVERIINLRLASQAEAKRVVQELQELQISQKMQKKSKSSKVQYVEEDVSSSDNENEIRIVKPKITKPSTSKPSSSKSKSPKISKKITVEKKKKKPSTPLPSESESSESELEEDLLALESESEEEVLPPPKPKKKSSKK